MDHDRAYTLCTPEWFGLAVDPHNHGDGCVVRAYHKFRNSGAQVDPESAGRPEYPMGGRLGWLRSDLRLERIGGPTIAWADGITGMWFGFDRRSRSLTWLTGCYMMAT